MARQTRRATRGHSRSQLADRGFLARWWWLVLTLAVIAAAVVIVLVVQQAGSEEPQPRPTVTGPPPTPAIETSPRETADPLAAALPDEVVRYAVVSQEEVAAAGDMLGGWRLQYSDGADGQFTLTAEQWRDTEHAEAAVQALAPELPDAAERDVVVAGDILGKAWIAPHAAVWHNGTVVLQIEAPGEDAAALFDAFPL